MQARNPVQPRSISIATLLFAFAILAYAIYSPALAGDFVSDDIHYLQGNGYLHELSVENVFAILDPTGPLIRIVENYAPVHLLLHAAFWQVFGADVRGHHLVNLVFHVLASGLLFALFRRTGIPELAAVLGAGFFLMHPANVEAVAWISQLKTTSAMVLMLLALLSHPKRPGLALLLFALALLAKPTAAVGLFVAVTLGLAATVRPSSGDSDRGVGEGAAWRWRWIGLWGLVLVGFAIAELQAFAQTAGSHVIQVPELDVRLRTMFAVAMRYLAMAVSGHGIAAFQEPPPATSWLDPWWLASIVALGGLAWRTVTVLRHRSPEAAYWVWAVVSFAPVSGAIPLPHIIADRYLYFMLPGLIGGVLLAGPRAIDRVFSAWRRPAPQTLGRGLAAIAIVWTALFAWQSFGRASVWQSNATLTADILAHSPEGRWALVELAGRSAERGDAAKTVAYLRRAQARGFDKLDLLLTPRYAGLRGSPDFDALMADLARGWVSRISAIAKPTQSDLMVLVQGQIVLGDIEAARGAIRRAIYVGGPMTDYLYSALDGIDQMERAAAQDAR